MTNDWISNAIDGTFTDERLRKAANALVLVLDENAERSASNLDRAYEAGTRDDWTVWLDFDRELYGLTNVRCDGLLTALGIESEGDEWTTLVPLVLGMWVMVGHIEVTE